MPEYFAHIVTAEASYLGDPSVTVIQGATDEFVAEYPLAEDADAHALLDAYGWEVAGTPAEVEPGYSVVRVEPQL